MFEELHDIKMPDSQIQYWLNDECYEFYAVSIITALNIFFTMSQQLSFPRNILNIS